MNRYRIICCMLLAFTAGNYCTAANDNISPSSRILARMDSIRQARGYASEMQNIGMNPTIKTMPLTTTANYTNLLNHAVGEIPIQSGVSPMGARTYNVPIETYPGIGDMTPQISLSYNSMQGNGIAGVGWNIAGLSSIIRTNKSLHYDGKVEGISQNADDAFMLDGQRLIRIANENGAPCYQTAQGNIKVKAALAGGDVSSFTVLYPDGRVGTYSSSDEGKMVYPITSLKNIDDIAINYTYTCERNNHLIQSITYSTNKAKIDFIYDERPDSSVSYSNGHPIALKKRLNKIICSLNNTVLREYPLTYTTINSASHLSSIGYTANGQSLNPVTFTYGTGTMQNNYTFRAIGLDYTNITTEPLNNKHTRIVKGKFDYTNSDGILSSPNRESYSLIMDADPQTNQLTVIRIVNNYIGQQNDQIYITPDLGNNNNLVTTLPIGYGYIDALCADITGTQQDYIVRVNNYAVENRDQVTFSVFRYSNTTHSCDNLYSRIYDFGELYTDPSGNKSLRPKHFYTGDFNGDGRQDIMAITNSVPFENAYIQCRIYDLADNRLLYSGSPINSNFIHSSYWGGFTIGQIMDVDRMYVMDYNNDGKSDICVIKGDGTYIYEFASNSSGVLYCSQVNTYTGLTRSSLVEKQLLIGEFNGDGLTDFLLSPERNDNDSNWRMFYSTGNGDFIVSNFTGPTAGDGECDDFIIQDVNSDGKSDLIKCYENKFTTFINVKSVPNVEVCTNTMDKNSAIAPTSITSHNKFSHVLTLKGNKLVKYSFQNDVNKQQLLTTMTNSLCNTECTTYKYPNDGGSSYRINTTTDINFPYVILREKIPFVASSQINIGDSTQNHIAYSFENLVMHRQGLGICGMEKFVVNGEQFTTTQIYNPAIFGTLTHDTIKSVSDGSLISTGTYTYDIVHPNADNDAFVQVNLIKKVTKDHLQEFTTTSDYTYNEYGFPYFEITSTSDGHVTEVIQDVTHHTDSKYMLNVVNQRIVETYHNGMTHNEKTTFPEMYYNRPLKKYHYINGNQASYETFTYRSNGLLSKNIIKHYNSSQTLSTTYLYDIYGRVTKELQSGRKSVSYTYNSNGQLATYTDRLGNATSYTYDAFGRKIRTDYADGTWETTLLSWQNGSPTNYGALADAFGYCVTTTHSGGKWEKAYYNTKNQNVENHYSALQGQTLVEYMTYDTHGNILTQSVPTLSNQSGTWIPWHRHTYDQLNRLTGTTRPYGKNSTYTYNKNKVTTVEDSIMTTRTYDSQGNMTAVTDPTGTTTYTYRPDGQMLSATVPCGLTTTVEYDNYGRRTRLIDPSAGTTTFTYNARGLIASKTDATGKQTKMYYDELKRLKRKEYVGLLTTTYTYDEFEQLTGETDSNGSTRSFGYDQYGRLAWDYQSIDSLGTHNLTRTYSYDDNGNLASVSYAQEEGNNAEPYGVERFEYSNGLLKKTSFEATQIGNNTFTIWDIESIDGFGNTDRAASGILKHYYMHDDLGLPIYIATEKNEEDILLEKEYFYNNNTGNMVFRRNFVYNKYEDFTYDHMNRLTGDGYATFSYDNATGNMTYNSRLGNITYGQLQSGYRLMTIDPLTGIGSTTSNYMSTQQQTATYNAMSRPATITENKHTLEFSYNGRGERIKSRFYKKDNSNPVLGTVITDLEQRYYLGNIYERHIKEDGEERVILYLGGDAYSAPAAFVMDEQYGPHMAYICRDHLGSIMHVASGQYSKEYSYDAWGNARNPETYEVQVPNSTQDMFYLGRGYTGHEHHGYFGLINMNARMYEPILGRFISPDPFVQMPDNSQNFNRYTYCLNNPLRYTDESGEWFLFDDLLAAIGGFAIGYVSHGISSGDWGWDAVASGLGGSVSSWFAYNTMGGSAVMSGFEFAGNSALNTAISYLTPSMNLSLGNLNISANPIAIFTGGVIKGNGFSFGTGLSATYSIGDFYIATGLSLTSQRGRFSYGGGYNDGTFGVSWFGSYYLGEDPQKTGTIRFKAGNWSIAHENDLDRMLGDGDDRYRTAGIEIGYKNYVIGATVYTNAAKLPKNRWNELDKEYNSNTWGSNGLGAYPNSTAYQSPVYIGHRWRNMMIRTGYNSPKVQDMTQNFIHKIGPFPYYKTPSTYNNPYFQIGSYNPFSLY